MTDIYTDPEADLTNSSVDGEYGSVEKALAGDYQLMPIELINNAWDNLQGLKATFWIATLIYIAISVAMTFLVAMVFGPIVDVISGDFSFVAFIAEISVGLVMAPMGAGLFMIALKFSVGAKIEVGELFKHFDKTIPLFITYILTFVFLSLGFLLLILPGIYLTIAFSMSVPLVVEKNMAPWEALTTSLKAVTPKWFAMLGFVLLAMLVFTVAAIPLGIGLIWALPLLMLAAANLYRDMFGVEDSTTNS